MDRRRFILSACAVLYTSSLAGCGTNDDASGDTDGGTDMNGDNTIAEKASSEDGTTTNGGDTTTENAGSEDSTTTNGDDTTTEDAGSDGGSKDLEITEHSVYIGEISYGVRGIVVNTSASEINYVEVNIEFFDGEGTAIDEGSDNTTALAADQEWEFEIRIVGRSMSDTSEIDDYDIEVSDSPL